MAGTFGGVSLDPTAQEYADTRVYYIAGDSFWYANMTFAVDAFRGWFETPGSATGNAARYAICVWGDDADGIRRTEAAGQGDSKVFNLSGARLSAPAKGKINIINNKKVLVR